MAVSSVYFIPDAEHDLISGYIQTHYKNRVPTPLHHLVLLYFYRLEEFSTGYKGANIKIKGLNNKKCKSSSSSFKQDSAESVFGRVIARHPYKYHWRLCWKNAKHCNVGFIDATEYKQYCDSDFDDGLCTYSLSIVDNQSGQIDFYLDLNKGNCSYTVDGMENYDNYFTNIDITKQFILAICMKQKRCLWKIISFETDEIFENRIRNGNDFYGMIGFCRSISDRKLKISYYEKAMRINQNSSFAFQEYIECLVQQKQFIKAYDMIMDKWNVFGHNKSNDRWVGYVAEQIYNLGNKYEFAVNLYNKIPNKILYESVWCGQKAHCYQKLGENKQALIEYDTFLNKTNLNHNDLMKSNIEDNIGNVHFVLKDYKNAIKHAMKAIKYAPQNSFALNNLGYYYWIIGKYKKAENCYKECLSNDNKHPLANGNLGNLLFEQKKEHEAEIYMRIALSIKADMEHSDVAPKLLLNYAVVLYNKEKYAESLQYCSELSQRNDFKCNENEHKCYYLYSKNYWKLAQIKEGLEYILKAIQLRPNHEDYLQMYHQYNATIKQQ